VWVSDVDLSASDLSTGKVPQASLKPMDWLWLKQNVSPGLKHGVRPGGHDPPLPLAHDLADYLLRDYCRVVGILSVAGIESFLRIPHFLSA